MSSPNFELSKAVLSLGSYQLTSGKGNASGYAGLGSQSPYLIDPVNFLPGFGGVSTGAADGSFWVKSGATLAPLSGTTFTANALTIGSVLMGTTSSGVYGIKQTENSRPLVLLGGSTKNEVWIGLNQTLLGGTTGAYDTPQWSITGAGACVFKATTFGGAVAMGGFNITSTGTIGNPYLLLNCNTGGISSTVTLALTASGGVTVPTVTGTNPGDTKAVNFASANTYYGRLGASNIWTYAQTFNTKPLFGAGANLAISDTSGLQTALDDRLPKAGGAMTGAIAMGNHLITGLVAPSNDTDAATKAYVDGKTITSTGGILNDLVVNGGGALTKGMAASVTTLTLAQATTSTSGYLSSADWNAFNSASTATATAKAANLVLAGPASGGSVAPTYRALVPADLATNVLKTTSYTVLTSGSNITSCTANTTTETPNIALAGAAVGDFVIATLSIPVPTGLFMFPYVYNTGNVRVKFINSTGSAITAIVADTVIKIVIIKFP